MTLSEAAGCSEKAWIAGVDAFSMAFKMDDLEDDASAELQAIIRKAISDHRDAIVLLEATLPSRGERRKG